MNPLTTQALTAGVVELPLDMSDLPIYDYRMTPLEFVERWLPHTKGKSWGEWGSRKLAQDLLSKATGYNWTTVSNWLSSTDRVPDLVMRHLWLLSQVWEFQIRLSNSTQSPELPKVLSTVDPSSLH